VHDVRVRAAVTKDAPRIGVVCWALSLFVVLAAAKAALLALRLADGALPVARPWLAVALVHEDVRLVVAFIGWVALAAAITRRWPGAARAISTAVVIVYAALTFWTAFNVPVARELSSPLTFSLLHATGGAIRDSVARYATPLNLGLPIALWAGALALPRVAGEHLRLSRRALAAIGAAAAAIVALGPMASRRAEVSSFHRNAVLALAETSLARHDRASRPAPPPLTAPACRPQDDPGAADLSELAGLARGRNVVWVVLESTGARALPAYGAARDVTPNISALATRAVVFDAAYAAYPESIKGLFSMLCGRAPPPGSEASELPRGRVLCASVAEAFVRAGVRTGLFHSGWFAYLGMDAVVRDRGFDVLADAGGVDSPYRSSFGVDDRSTARRLLAFVDEVPAGKRFFAVFMPIAGHHPYHAPGVGPRPLLEASDHDAYLNDLQVADDAFGVLRDGLRSRGLDDQTVYVVVGDHGEAFREHPGNLAHALFLYEENVRVPFFIAAPGAPFAPRRAPQLASLIDLAPTTLALAALAREPAHEGRSLLAVSAPRVARFFTEQGSRRGGLRDGRWKVIVDADVGRTEVYDLATDPGERADRSAEAARVSSSHRFCLGL
jgi:phosphoglycerol transferase MdoB-like AlkP superfamily enzyme